MDEAEVLEWLIQQQATVADDDIGLDHVYVNCCWKWINCRPKVNCKIKFWAGNSLSAAIKYSVTHMDSYRSKLVFWPYTKFFFLGRQNLYGGVYEIFLARNFLKNFWKNLFFAFYSRYQNVRTERLKWRVQKVDITSGCPTIMIYICNIISHSLLQK